jgi:hypothetical protein
MELMMNSYSREYNIWAMMRQRCSNPKAANYLGYGARGIKVCERWNRFSNFIADLGPAPSPAHTLDRIDNNGDYTPENCRWADVLQQQNNRRNSVFIEAFGKRLTLAQWARETGLSRDIIKHRIFVMSMPPEQALGMKEKMSHNQKPVRQYTLTGELVSEFSSLAEASIKTKINKAAIFNNLSGRSKTSAGFLWKYVHSESNTTNPKSSLTSM